MKNKKFLTIIAVVIMSGMLLTAGALAFNPEGNAYEQFKALSNQDHDKIDNATVSMSMVAVDNGEPVISLHGTMKKDTTSEQVSGIFAASCKTTNSFEIYENKDELFLHLMGSENWYKTTRKDEESNEDHTGFSRGTDEDSSKAKQMKDAFLDTIMRDYKDQVTMTEENGLRTFSLKLDEGNIPVLLQTLFQLSDMRENECCETPEQLNLLPQELQGIFTDMKDCEYDVDLTEKKLESLAISFTVDQEKCPVALNMSIRCSGTDTDGAAHSLNVDFSVTLSDVGTTVPDIANPDTAAITTIDSEAFERTGRRCGK